MNFNKWLITISDKPELSDFIIKIKPFFTDAGFNGPEFERRVDLGLRQIDIDITNSLKPNDNVDS